MFKKESISIIVTGMKCDHCKNKVIESLMALDNITKVKVNLKTGEVICFYQNNIDTNKVKETITNLGYTVK